ncbi:MAG: filamentous hemagglutinin N-terminal domain-containing protein [Deltaproteobacteria bacterium]|nr:filamentous hemagglutinin N-terminal domain-containing protein [Deltaproteobacteria bacterium]
MDSRRRRSEVRARRTTATLGSVLVGLLAATASADVVRDGRIGSAGAGAVATEVGSGGELRYLIRESDGQRAGNNLFHSFTRLDLTANEVAVYEGPAEIRNLITTITGGRSSIDGRIRSEIAGANLLLINPDGVVFGENASVDVSGAFTVSTADRLLFSNGDVVETGGAAPPSILSVADPDGFGFLGKPAPIRVEGSRIALGIDQSLHLVGGDIDLLGGRTDGGAALVATRSGRLDLVSLASAGSVYLEPEGVRIDGSPRMGDVTIADEMVVTTSGINPNPFGGLFEFPGLGSGAVFIRADDLTIRDAELRTLTVTATDASDISIGLAGRLTIEGGSSDRQSGIFADSGFVLPPAPGQVVTSPVAFEIPYSDGTIVQAGACGAAFCTVRYISSGNAGDVRIQARDVVLRNGGKITARSEFAGAAGTIDVAFAEEMIVEGRRGPDDVSLITTNANGTGNPGSIVIRSDSGRLRMDDFGALVIQNGQNSPADGLPGRITIDVAELSMAGNARIDSSTRGAGPGGLLDIRARDRITLAGRTDAENFTGISTLSQPGSTGDAGEIRVATRALVMRDGAEISARPADATSQGAAGNLRFEIGDRLVVRGATISTESPNAAGGNIDLAVGGVLDLRNASITTSVTSGPESGGNITLRPGPDALILANSQIIAQADAGAGGVIDLEAALVLVDGDSLIDASSRRGINGRVLINGVEGSILPEVAQLATPAADASSLVREPCAARRPGASNRFVVDERPRLAVDADEYLAAPLAMHLEDASIRVASADGERSTPREDERPTSAGASETATRFAQADSALASSCIE